MAEKDKLRLTAFGEEIPQIMLFEIAVTSRCNMNCSFCLQHGRSYAEGKDMTLDEFKHLVDGIVEYKKKMNAPLRVCIAGREPFLNKDLAQMSRYAVEKLGRDVISITTNVALFPTNLTDAAFLLDRMGRPRFNLSIDREHLRYGKEMEARIRTFFTSAKQTGVKTEVINVAQTAYQQKHRFPKNIVHLIPKEIRETVATSYHHGRREFYSNQHDKKIINDWLSKLKKGQAQQIPPYPVVTGLGVAPLYGCNVPVAVTFSTNGRAYLFSQVDPLHFPQLSIGNWRRENIHDITHKNLPYKINMIKHWLGMIRTGDVHKHQTLHHVEQASPKKMKLFAEYATRRIKTQQKLKRNRLPR
ncbi:MAG: radical SAM protein [archaeon]